jgi:hypothetical protein
MGPPAATAATAAAHIVQHMIGDATVVAFEERTPDRPAALDVAQAWLNDPCARHNRAETVTAILTGNWEPIADRLGMPADEIRCFLSDVWGDERDLILAGIADALTVHVAWCRIRFDCAYGPTGVRAACDGDDCVITIISPQR